LDQYKEYGKPVPIGASVKKWLIYNVIDAHYGKTWRRKNRTIEKHPYS
jgi:hypothetical protein